MANFRDNWRAGVRPALYASLFVAVLFLVALPMFPEYTVAQARWEFLLVVGGTFGLVTALYTTGLVQPHHAGRRTNPWILGLVVVTLVLLVASECR